jgi:hypothetical protein
MRILDMFAKAKEEWEVKPDLDRDVAACGSRFCWVT